MMLREIEVNPPLTTSAISNIHHFNSGRLVAFNTAVLPAARHKSPRPGKTPCYTPAMEHDRLEVPDDPPPFLKTWPRVYCAVIVYLSLLIAAFYAFTRLLS